MTRSTPTRSARPFAPRRATVAAFAGLAAVTTLAGCAADAVEAEVPAPTTETTETAPTTESSAPPASSDSVYADGTYTADGDYQSPNGAESVTVTVTIADDIVTAIEVDGHAMSGNSLQFQTQFASGIAAKVVGVALEDVSVSRVAGSSLTSGGFNAAIDAIQAEARS
jgi:uncharacterized protein with FMN-binding domain